MPLKYIGDLSKADARLLVDVAEDRSFILEFGVGGSTMLFAQAMPTGGTFVSVDTSEWWIERTKEKLAHLKISVEPKFVVRSTPVLTADPDFVFIDGADEYRLSFALAAWPLLIPGGSMAFHDTRRPRDISNVLAVIQNHFEEVGTVRFNKNGSNITIVRKRLAPTPYENWHDVEKKERWMSGYDPAPANWPELNTPEVE
jgi:predicted O-methyltransferase YrrM